MRLDLDYELTDLVNGVGYVGAEFYRISFRVSIIRISESYFINVH